ncbi:unnamed protein product [Clavelina lepadiformis]|uniref:Uncharacterized protein n=1 Tax=Clavelina lepadiformis TaxID=159417 RepID=A0ABP0GAD1_CLALP
MSFVPGCIPCDAYAKEVIKFVGHYEGAELSTNLHLLELLAPPRYWSSRIKLEDLADKDVREIFGGNISTRFKKLSECTEDMKVEMMMF